jgi:hypothetical protein
MVHTDEFTFPYRPTPSRIYEAIPTKGKKYVTTDNKTSCVKRNVYLMAAACCYWNTGVSKKKKKNTTSILRVTTYHNMRRNLKDREFITVLQILMTFIDTDNESALYAEVFAKPVNLRAHFLYQYHNIDV